MNLWTLWKWEQNTHGRSYRDKVWSLRPSHMPGSKADTIAYTRQKDPIVIKTQKWMPTCHWYQRMEELETIPKELKGSDQVEQTL